MVNRYPRQDPILEIKRDGYLATGQEIQDDLLELYRMSVLKTNHLHANLLLTTESGFSMLRDICRLVTYVDPNIINTSWQDFAVKLGYDNVDVKCFKNLRGNTYDPTELVIQYYAAKKESTVGNILQALLELGFLPALHEAQKHLDKFLNEVECENGGIIKAPLNTDSEAKYIIKAASFKPGIPAIFKPSPLKDDITIKMMKSGYEIAKEGETVQSFAPPTQKRNIKYCKQVMLSFARDGLTIALKVASVLRATTNKKGLPIGVLMLYENDNEIQANPGQLIPDIMSKMDCIIPVLTEGYFTALRQPDFQSKLLDERYIQFVLNIMVSKFIHNCCNNIQVRPIIPSEGVNDICNKQEFIHNTIFSAWKSEEDIPVLANYIIKLPRKKKTISTK